ncbi:hypothetical protein [Neorhizobium sp. S3-V5DH]|uniref:hypothetical protein n=1 Tax=Neorhizobium sp. S3-V5DH TaxID=2485166 RepID=UPI0010E43882|nr:hypothetical protein [Neorhizobium sp. S3-V5DH]TCV62292.1 hypothetical protein EDE09_12456 [Neorhizobium sp. S3-V5DH]
MTKGYYEVRKNEKLGHWLLTHIGMGWMTPMGKFKKRKEAILRARVFAGRRGKVVVA